MTARGIARHYAALLPGGVDGVSLLSRERVRAATTSQPTGVAEDGSQYQALGYGLGGLSPESFGHAGFGGAIGFADPKSGYAVGFTRNHFSSHDPLKEIFETLKAAIQVN
jgi:CubicO group peptidase (beta-lactamase class C family)